MMVFAVMLDSEADKALFSTLYEKHIQDMLKYAAYLLSNPRDAEDIVQEAFLRTARHINKFYPDVCHSSRGLLVIIVRNLCRSKWRRDGLINVIPWEEWRSDETRQEDASAYDQTQLLADFIEHLSPAYSDVLKLKYIYGYTLEEAAHILDITPTAARARASRAYKKLRVILEKESALHE